MKHLLVISMYVGLLWALVGCSGAQKAPGEGFHQEFEGAPDWVRKSCAGLSGDKSKLVCGVGSATGIRNVSLARKAAIGRAKSELASSLQTKVRRLLKDYSASIGDTDRAVSDEQKIVDVSKQITKFTLTGTRIEDTWVSNQNTYWTIVVLDLEKFKKSIEGMKELSDELRQAIEKRAEKAFSELDAATK